MPCQSGISSLGFSACTLLADSAPGMLAIHMGDLDLIPAPGLILAQPQLSQASGVSELAKFPLCSLSLVSLFPLNESVNE